MAEAIFKSLVDNVEVISAGFNTVNGRKASENAIKVCRYAGLDLSEHKSKNFNDIKLQDDDLILTLTCDIRDRIRRSCPALKVYTIKEYAGEEDYLDIKDPAGGDMKIYEICYDEIREYLEKIVKKNMLMKINGKASP